MVGCALAGPKVGLFLGSPVGVGAAAEPSGPHTGSTVTATSCAIPPGIGSQYSNAVGVARIILPAETLFWKPSTRFEASCKSENNTPAESGLGAMLTMARPVLPNILVSVPELSSMLC